MNRALSLLLACIILPVHAFAGAWTQKAKSLQLISTGNLYETDTYFDTKGTKRRQPTYYKQEISTYAEYGFTDDLTLGGQLNVARAYQESAMTQNSTWNIGDTELFARKRLWRDDRRVVSLQPSLILPSPDGHSLPKIGSDHPAAGLRASYGQGFTLLGRQHYADISGGYLYRAGRAADQYKLDATVGLSLSRRWEIIPQAFITKNTKRIKNATFTQSAADDYDLVNLRLLVQYNLSRRAAVQAGVYKHVAGKNTGDGGGMLLSYVRNF